MAADFESLNFEISVNAGDAVQQVRDLAQAIGSLARNLSKLDLGKIAPAFSNVSASAKKAAKDVDGLADAAEKIKNAKIDKGDSSAALPEIFWGKKTEVKDIEQSASVVSDAMSRVRNAMSSVNPGTALDFKALAPNFKKRAVEVQDAFAEMGKKCAEEFYNSLYGANGAAPKAGSMFSGRSSFAMPDTISFFRDANRSTAFSLEDISPGFSQRIAQEGAELGQAFWSNFTVSGGDLGGRVSAQLVGGFERLPSSAIEGIGDSLENAIKQTGTYSNVTSTLTKVTTALTPALQGAKISVKAFSDAMTAAATPISAVIIAIQAAVKVATFLVDQFKEFNEVMKKFKQVADGINEKFNPFVALKKELASLIALAKRQVLRRAINAVIKAVAEGLQSGVQNLAEYDERFSATIQSFHNAMGLFKNSIGVAVAPIISYFIPAINALLSALTRAMNMIARLTALLTGQHTYTIAKDYQEIGDSAGGASGKVKELQRTILGFDEINRLNGNNGSGGGGGGGAGDAISAYETMEVGDWPYDSWGEALLAFVKWVDREGVPKLQSALRKVASAVNDFSRELYNALTFEGVQEAISDLATHLGETLNNFLTGGEENGGLNWADMGKAVGMAIQTAFNFAANFLKQLDFLALGQSIAEFVNNAIDQLKPEDIAEVLFTPIRAAFGLVVGFFSDFDFPEFAEKAGQVVNRLVEGIAKLFGEQVADKKGNVQTRLEIVVNNIAEGLVKFFDTVNWTQLFNTLTNVVSSIVNGLKTILDKLTKNKEFMNALHQFVDFIINTAIQWFTLKLRAAFSVGKGVNIWGSLFSSLFQSNDYSTTTSFTGDGIYDPLMPPTGFVSDVNGAATAMDGLRTTITKTSPPIITAGNDISRLGTNITDTAGVVGARSKEMGTSIGGIGTAAKGANTTVQNAARGISTEFSNLNVNASKPMRDLASTANTQFTAVKNSVTNNMSSARTSAVNSAEALRKDVASKFQSAASSANTEFANAKNHIVNNLASAKNSVPSFWDVGSNIKNGVINGMGDFKGQLTNWANQFKSHILKNFAIKSPSRWARDEVGTYLSEGIALGMEQDTSIQDACAGIREGITSEFDSMSFFGGVSASTSGRSFDVASAIGEQVMAGIASMDNGTQQPIVCEVYLDRDRIATAVTRGQQAQNRRYSSTAMA